MDGLESQDASFAIVGHKYMHYKPTLKIIQDFEILHSFHQSIQMMNIWQMNRKVTYHAFFY